MTSVLNSIILKELKLFFRNKQAVISLLSFPFLIFFLLSFSFSNLMHREPIIEPLKVIVVDHEQSLLSKMLIGNFKDNDAFSKFVSVETASDEEANEKFTKGDITGIIAIPPDFSKSLQSIDNLPLTVTLNSNQPLKALILKNMMSSYGQFVSSVQIGVNALYYYMDKIDIPYDEKEKINEDVSIDLTFTALGRSAFFNFYPYEKIPSTDSLEYFVVALSVIFFMYVGLTAGGAVIYEKNSRCLSRMKASPIPAQMIIAGKFIAYTLLCLFYGMIFVIPVTILFKIKLAFAAGDIFAFMLCSIFFIISLSIFMSIFFREQNSFVLFGNMFIFISGIVGGSFIPLQLMPPFVQKISEFTPNYWIIRGGVYLLNSYSIQYIWKIPVTLAAISMILLILSSLKLKKVIA